VVESAAIMKGLGGVVTERIYPGAPHTIVPDEIDNVRRILDSIEPGEAS
jgi:hypothetical protein